MCSSASNIDVNKTIINNKYTVTYYLTQTEYLEETGLRAEARSCAGRRGCSQPWDAAVPAGAAVSQHWDVEPCETIYINILSHMVVVGRRALAAIVFSF